MSDTRREAAGRPSGGPCYNAPPERPESRAAPAMRTPVRMMRRLLLILAVSMLAAASAIWILGSWILRVPSRAWSETTPPPGSQEVSFTASDGTRLEGWWWPAEQRSDAFLLLHDAGADRLEMLPRATWLHE